MRRYNLISYNSGEVFFDEVYSCDTYHLYFTNNGGWCGYPTYLINLILLCQVNNLR